MEAAPEMGAEPEVMPEETARGGCAPRCCRQSRRSCRGSRARGVCARDVAGRAGGRRRRPRPWRLRPGCCRQSRRSRRKPRPWRLRRDVAGRAGGRRRKPRPWCCARNVAGRAGGHVGGSRTGGGSARDVAAEPEVMPEEAAPVEGAEMLPAEPRSCRRKPHLWRWLRLDQRTRGGCCTLSRARRGCAGDLSGRAGDRAGGGGRASCTRGG